ncbi:MAG: DUF4136 domain-containing protein [Cytophagaceae bacterium]
MQNTMRGLIGIFVMVVMVAAACGRRVHTSASPRLDLAQYKTYAWLPDNQGENQQQTEDGMSDVYVNDIMREHLRNQVNQELQAKGYRINTENPDFLVSLKTFTERRRAVAGFPVYSGLYYGQYGTFGYPGFYSPFMYHHPFAYQYSSYDYIDGTLVLDIIDRENKKLVWRGWTEGREIRPRRVQRELSKDLDKILDEIPG